MKKYCSIVLCLFLTGCFQASQQTANSVSASGDEIQDIQSLPPIYTPLVDMHKKSASKFSKDHAECRQQAEPQERAARAAMAKQQSGAALQTASTIVSMIPVAGFQQASVLANAANVAQSTGATLQDAGAMQGAGAMTDYMLVVNTCLSRRGYILLRG